MASKNVASIFERRNAEMVAGLTDLLKRAQAGTLRGLAFTAKLGSSKHHVGFLGDYYSDPEQALAGASRMQYKANQLISARDFEPETQSMPL